MDGKYMVNEKYSFKLSNYARDLLFKSVVENQLLELAGKNLHLSSSFLLFILRI